MLKNGKTWWVVGIFLILLIASGWGASLYRRWVHTPVNPFASEKIKFVINQGDNGAQVAQKLQGLGLIKSPLIFRIYLRIASIKGNLLQAGEYTLNPSMSLAQIVKRFGHGTFDLKLTFIEGWRKEEYAIYLKEKLGEDFAREFLADPQAQEGFLFPDTYIINNQTTAPALVSLLRSNFDKKVDARLRAAIESQGIRLEQGVILASIVEREVKHGKDRPLIADILIKRFKNNWPLEADATTQYAKANLQCQISNLQQCDWWPQELTEEDLKIDSPFNTRKATGLPPIPIANPGLLSIQAVANPQASENWYYLSDQEGNIHYSKTLDEHNQKIGLYLK